MKRITRVIKRVFLLLVSFVDYLKYAQMLGVKMGKNCYITGRPKFGSEPYLINMGDRVLIAGSGTQFITHEGAHWVLQGMDPEKYKHVCGFGKINIGNNVYIGTRCTILRGVTIGDNCIVGANSLVNKSLPSGGVYAGVPAKRICSVEEFGEKMLADMPEIDLENYRRNKKEELLKIADNFPKR